MRTVLFAVVGALCGVACGSTSGEGEAWIVFQPPIDVEGTVVSDVPTGGTTTEVLGPPPIQVGAGLGANVRIHRAIYSFDLSTVPTGGVIDSATLYIYQYDVIGNPYGQLGDLRVDHVDIGADLDPSDFAGGTLKAGIGTLSTSPAIDTLSVAVKSLVEADLYNGRPASSFRIYFSLDETATLNQQLVSLVDTQGGGPAGILPILQIAYRFDN